jgi:hypothetical protein
VDRENHLISNYHSVQVRRFGTSNRPGLVNLKLETPGPGTYRPPSDFGYLNFSARASSTMGLNRSVNTENGLSSRSVNRTAANDKVILLLQLIVF